MIFSGTLKWVWNGVEKRDKNKRKREEGKSKKCYGWPDNKKRKKQKEICAEWMKKKMRWMICFINFECEHQHIKYKRGREDK